MNARSGRKPGGILAMLLGVGGALAVGMAPRPARGADEVAGAERTLCIDDLENPACAAEDLLCTNNPRQDLIHLTSQAVALLYIYAYHKDPNIDLPDGSCTGFMFTPAGLPARGDLLMTSRHCVDHVYYKCVESSDDPYVMVDLDEPAPPLGRVKVVAHFFAEYLGGCVCNLPDPPEACRNACNAPDVGDPDWPCNTPFPPFIMEDWGYSGSGDWAVLRIDPEQNDDTLPGNYGVPSLVLYAQLPIGYGGTDYPLYTPQHPRGRCREVAFGEAGAVVGNDFQHRMDTEGGSSGSPVFGVYGVDQNGPNGVPDGIADEDLNGRQDASFPLVVGVHRAGGCSTTDNGTWNRAVDGVRVWAEKPGNAADPVPDNDRARLVRAIWRAVLPGDYNLDGTIGLADFTILLNKFGAGNRANVLDACGDPRYSRYADHDGDGQITFIDLQMWLQLYRKFIGIPLAPFPRPPLAGDMDADGDVDGGDLAAWSPCLQGPQKTLTMPCLFADTDVDGDVDLRDFAVLARNWNAVE